MDLTKFLGQDTQEQSTQRLSKEEYAAQKKQEREEIWGMIDGKAQEVFQNGNSLKGLDNVSVNGNLPKICRHVPGGGTSFIFSRIKSRSASVTLNLICTVLLRPSMLSLLSIPRVWDTSQ